MIIMEQQHSPILKWAKLLSTMQTQTRSILMFLLLTLLLTLQGCATYSSGFAKVESDTANHNLDSALKSLEKLNLTGADEALHHLNKGTLLRLKESYAESNKHFDVAKNLAEKLNAISLSEQFTSVSVNDTFKAYEGLPSEQMMIYAFKALNYIQMGDTESAAVEARQFDIKQGLIARKYSNATYLSGAFVRYLNSMIYEDLAIRDPNSLDSARIEMEKAIDGYKQQHSGFSVPKSLTADLARVNNSTPAPSEIVFILQNGLGPSLHEVTIRVANPNAQHGSALLSLAVPKFAKRSVPVARVELSAGTLTASSELVENINDIAEKSFNDRLPLITARAVSRLVLKNAAAKETKKKSAQLGSLGFLADIAIDVGTAVTERADTRSWSLLPGAINMARLPIPAGIHNVTATYFSQNGSMIGTRVFNNVSVKPGRKTFISDYFMNQPSPARAPQ
jgi:uncharacterized protein